MAISSGLGSSALLPAGLGFRNKIINGDFGINQRAFSSTTTSNVYIFDRWLTSKNGDGTVTYSSQTFTPGNAIAGQEPKTFLRIATSGQTASNSLSVIAQRIEDVRTLAGQTATLSFYAKASSGTPGVAVTINQVMGTGGSPSSDVYTFVAQSAITTSWARYTITFVVPSISGKTIGTNNDNYLELNLWTSSFGGPSGGGSIGIQNNTIDFWGLQLEQNYQPTPFEQRPIGVELALCQRYYAYMDYTVGGSGANFVDGYQINTGYITSWFKFPQTMRIRPTSVVLNIGGSSNTQGFTATAVGPDYIQVYAIPTATGRGYYYVANLAGSAEL